MGCIREGGVVEAGGDVRHGAVVDSSVLPCVVDGIIEAACEPRQEEKDIVH